MYCKIAHPASTVVVVLSVLFLTGCGGEAIDLTPTPMDAGMPPSDMMPMQTGPDGSVDPDTGTIEMQWPNLELFVETVQPIMVGCGNLTCHKAEMVTITDTFLQFESGAGGVITEAQAENNFTEFTQDRLIDYEQPGQSKFLRHHPSSHPGFILAGSMTDGLVVAWIEDALIAPEDKMNMEGIIDYRCDEIEITDQQAPWRSAYEDRNVNQILVGTLEMPDGRCGGADCHAGQNGGRLLLAPPDVGCSDDYNFLEAIALIDRADILNSALLVEPLGEPSQATGRIEHGGRVVFQGRDDPDYIALKRWIEDL